MHVMCVTCVIDVCDECMHVQTVESLNWGLCGAMDWSSGELYVSVD